VEIRRLRAGDGALLREVRLRALADAPHAFGSWHARELEFEPELWEGRAAGGETGAVFVAVEADRCAGMAGAFVPGDDGATVILWGMWVEPAARRRGLGRELAAAVAAWAREHGASELRLAVTDSELAHPAAALYRALGFVATGESEELESNPSLRALVMSRPV